MIERNSIIRRTQRKRMINTQQELGEQGFAAIIIAIVLVVVLSLVTVGFAALMRSEQRSALDRQLNNAAYYAAESGINDARAAVKAGYIKAKTVCDNTNHVTGSATDGVDYGLNGHQYLLNTTVDGNSNTGYTCLLINPNPSTLEYSRITTDLPTTALVTGSDSDGGDKTVSKLVFSWQDASGGTAFADASTPLATFPKFPPVSSWKDSTGNQITGVLRVAVTPLGSTVATPSSSFDRTSLIANTYTAFSYPQKHSTTTTLGTMTTQSYSGNAGNNSGAILDGKCNTGNLPRSCSIVVDVSSLGQTTFLLHLSSIYNDTQVTVTAYDSSNKVMQLKGAQTLIDSTGKAQDVLRRLQVRLPAGNSYDYPEFNVETGGNVCKQLSTYPDNLALKNKDPGNLGVWQGSASNACNSPFPGI